MQRRLQTPLNLHWSAVELVSLESGVSKHDVPDSIGAGDGVHPAILANPTKSGSGHFFGRIWTDSADSAKLQ